MNRTRFVIDPEFRAYLPTQRSEENDALRIKLQMEGCKPGALTVAKIGGEHILIDGHHTNDICKAEGIKLSEPIVINFPNRDEAKAWMRQNQLARRNLTDQQFTYFLGEEFNARKQPHGGQKPGIRQNDGSVSSTAERLADEHGVSQSTVERAGQFADAVNSIGEQNPAAKEAILAGKSDATKSQVIAARQPDKLYCKSCRADGPKRGCRQCKIARGRSIASKTTAARKHASKLSERLIPQLQDLFKVNKITPRLLPEIAALDRNRQGVVLELIQAGTNPRRAIAKALGPGRDPGDEVPAKRKPKSGRPFYDLNEYKGIFGALYRQVDRVRDIHRLETTPASEKLERDLQTWDGEFRAWHSAATKAPKAEE